MSDIFQEVEEEVRREELKKLWDRYGNLLIAMAILVIVGVGSWSGWDWYQRQQADKAGAAFVAASKLSTDGKAAEAEAAFMKLTAEGTSGYRVLARLRAAGEMAKRDRAAAVAAYDAVSSDGAAGKLLQDLAQIRAGLLLVDSAPYAEMTKRLDPLAQFGNAWRHSARELLALSAWRTGDIKEAGRWAELARADADTPQGVRQRLDILGAVMGTIGQ